MMLLETTGSIQMILMKHPYSWGSCVQRHAFKKVEKVREELCSTDRHICRIP